jgi:hypothetical protein
MMDRITMRSENELMEVVMYSRWMITNGSRLLIGLLSVFLLGSTPLLRADEASVQVDLAANADVTVIGALSGEPVTVVNPGALTGALRAIAADVNGDVVSDLIIGVPSADPPLLPSGESRSNAGAAYIVFGRAGLPSPTIRDLETQPPDVILYGAGATDEFGSALAAGDVNKDGFKDIIVGAPNADGPGNARTDVGEAYVVFGGPGLAQTRTRDMANPSPPASSGPDVTIIGWGGPQQKLLGMDLAGSALASGDINGDGADDVVVGAPGQEGRDGTRTDAGAVYVFYGGGANMRSGSVRDASMALPSGVDMVIYGKTKALVLGFELGSNLGVAVAVGDVNGDRIGDVIMGARAAFVGTGNDRAAGEVYVVFGSNAQPPIVRDVVQTRNGPPPPNVTFLGIDTGDLTGSALAAGDVTSDGIDDILISALGARGPENKRPLCGEVFLVAGSTALNGTVDLRTTAPALTVIGTDAGDQIGFSLAIGDLNGGAKDVIIGAPAADGPGNAKDGAGEVYVLLASAQLLSTPTKDLAQSPPDVMIVGDSAVDQVGFSVAVGDFNGDNTGDLITTSPFADGQGASPKSKAGITYVLYKGGS